MFDINSLYAPTAHHTGKLQTFEDTRFGNTATLRIDQSADKPFVLRCRSRFGHMWFISHYETAREAKLALERLTDPCNEDSYEFRCNWWTVSGFVCDVE